MKLGHREKVFGPGSTVPRPQRQGPRPGQRVGHADNPRWAGDCGASGRMDGCVCWSVCAAVSAECGCGCVASVSRQESRRKLEGGGDESDVFANSGKGLFVVVRPQSRFSRDALSPPRWNGKPMRRNLASATSMRRVVLARKGWPLRPPKTRRSGPAGAKSAPAQQ